MTSTGTASNRAVNDDAYSWFHLLNVAERVGQAIDCRDQPGSQTRKMQGPANRGADSRQIPIRQCAAARVFRVATAPRILKIRSNIALTFSTGRISLRTGRQNQTTLSGPKLLQRR